MIRYFGDRRRNDGVVLYDESESAMSQYHLLTFGTIQD